MASTNKKSKFLDLPYGTAMHRLRKAVMFQLVQQAKRDICYRCGLVIGSVDELTIEHKQEWEGVSVELFWSLDNIAFSHARCNKPSRFRQEQILRVQRGFGRCSTCKQEKPINQFSLNKHNSCGYDHHCRECKSIWNAKRSRKKTNKRTYPSG